LVVSFNSSIYIVRELYGPEVASRWRFRRQICVIWKNPYGEICTILFRRHSPPDRSMSYLQFSWNLADRKSVKLCVICQTIKTKIRLAVSLSHLRG